jgi:hypothetical protein
MRVLAILAASLFVSACAAVAAPDETMDTDGAPHLVGTLLDPVCAPDGSVVRLQFPNDQGSFDGAMASRENCPWNQ